MDGAETSGTPGVYWWKRTMSSGHLRLIPFETPKSAGQNSGCIMKERFRGEVALRGDIVYTAEEAQGASCCEVDYASSRPDGNDPEQSGCTDITEIPTDERETL